MLLLSVPCHHNLKGLQCLYNSIEFNVRGLQALAVFAGSYGSFHTSILMDKLPAEIQIIVSRELTGETWSREELMNIVIREVSAREQSAVGGTLFHLIKGHSHGLQLHSNSPSPAAALMSSSQQSPYCVYCE